MFRIDVRKQGSVSPHLCPVRLGNSVIIRYFPRFKVHDQHLRLCHDKTVDLACDAPTAQRSDHRRFYQSARRENGGDVRMTHHRQHLLYQRVTLCLRHLRHMPAQVSFGHLVAQRILHTAQQLQQTMHQQAPRGVRTTSTRRQASFLLYRLVQMRWREQRPLRRFHPGRGMREFRQRLHLLRCRRGFRGFRFTGLRQYQAVLLGRLHPFHAPQGKFHPPMPALLRHVMIAVFPAPGLGDALRTLLLGLTESTPSFQHLMAANALQAEPPLNFRGELAGRDSEAIDLKKFGSRIFVDAARIFALSTGTRAVNTADRLRQAGGQVGLVPAEIAAVDAAFSQILRLRLQQQVASLAAGEALDYGLKPASLHDVDRAILREALRQARRLQQRLKLNYEL